MSTKTDSVPNTLRRSQLGRWHQQHGARYTMGAHPQIVSHYEQADEQDYSKEQLTLCDLSLLDRTGYKGSGAGDWLSAYTSLPVMPNEAVTSVLQHTLIARLSHEEYLLIDTPQDTALPGEVSDVTPGFATALDQHFAHDKPPLTYFLPRRDSHCLFSMCGQSVPAMMAKLCAIDLSLDRFAEGAVTQTSVARLNAIVVRQLNGQLDGHVPRYLVLADASAAEYLWHCLLDAMIEFSGAAVGLCELLKHQHADK